MALSIWYKKYTVRRFEPQKYIKGIPVSDYSDFPVPADIQPDDSDKRNESDAGAVTSRALKGWSSFRFHPADDESGTKGDWLWYDGHWFECVSCVAHGNTILAHYNSKFTQVKADKISGMPPEIEV